MLTSNSNTYHLNEDRTIATFYPTKKECKRKLSSTEYFYTTYFINEGLCFKGEVHLERFLDAMHHTLQDFDCLFFQIYKNEANEMYASYSTEVEHPNSIQLEIEQKDVPLHTFAFDSILPNQVDPRIQGVTTDQFDNLPMGVFKLTIFNDGFVIGYYLNHAFFDQSSMVYFFKYLSHMYTHGRENMTLKKPKLVDTDYLTENVEQPEFFGNLKDFQEHSASYIGFKYTAPNAPSKSCENDIDKATQSEEHTENATPAPDFASYKTVEIQFNSSEIIKLKSTVNQYLSINDFIHAIILKIYSFNPHITSDKIFEFGFACNMRKYCGLNEEAIANILSHPLMLLKFEDLQQKSILELAKQNRQCVSGLSLKFLKESLIWYKQFQEYQENSLQYASGFNILSARVTNWSTFDYDSIQFDNATPIELKAACLAPFRVNVISYVKKNGEQLFRTEISVPLEGIESLKKLEQETGLFTAHIPN